MIEQIDQIRTDIFIVLYLIYLSYL